MSSERLREAGRSGHTVKLLETLIDRVRDCERVFDLTYVARHGSDTADIVFIDDLSDVLTINRSINEQSADSASMALAAIQRHAQSRAARPVADPAIAQRHRRVSACAVAERQLTNFRA